MAALRSASLGSAAARLGSALGLDGASHFALGLAAAIEPLAAALRSAALGSAAVRLNSALRLDRTGHFALWFAAAIASVVAATHLTALGRRTAGRFDGACGFRTTAGFTAVHDSVQQAERLSAGCARDVNQAGRQDRWNDCSILHGRAPAPKWKTLIDTHIPTDESHGRSCTSAQNGPRQSCDTLTPISVRPPSRVVSSPSLAMLHCLCCFPSSTWLG